MGFEWKKKHLSHRYTKQEKADKADEKERAPDPTPSNAPSELPDDLAGKELDVLAQLLGKKEAGKEKAPEFRLSLFATELEERSVVIDVTGGPSNKNHNANGEFLPERKEKYLYQKQSKSEYEE